MAFSIVLYFTRKSTYLAVVSSENYSITLNRENTGRISLVFWINGTRRTLLHRQVRERTTVESLNRQN